MRKILAIAILLLLCHPGKINAQVTIFLRAFDHNNAQINGESVDKSHSNWGEYNNYGNVTTNCQSPIQQGTCSMPATGHFIFTLFLDKTINPLRSEMYSQSLLKAVDVEFVRQNGGASAFTYYKIRLENVAVASISDAISSGDGRNTVQVELDAAKFGFNYIPQNPNGQIGTPVKFGWDRQANIPWTAF